MSDDGETKDDVKLPEGEVGEKIIKLFKTEEKDTSKLLSDIIFWFRLLTCFQMSSFSLLWVKRRRSKPRRRRARVEMTSGRVFCVHSTRAQPPLVLEGS